MQLERDASHETLRGAGPREVCESLLEALKHVEQGGNPQSLLEDRGASHGDGSLQRWHGGA
ncbi:MAG: hypothetical protein KDA61_21295 [Planctomycetales bacterium]|nr:hypothetical protein [Planctomycetales bacterium]